jgi:hypothetical protein
VPVCGGHSQDKKYSFKSHVKEGDILRTKATHSSLVLKRWVMNCIYPAQSEKSVLYFYILGFPVGNTRPLSRDDVIMYFLS